MPPESTTGTVTTDTDREHERARKLLAAYREGGMAAAGRIAGPSDNALMFKYLSHLDSELTKARKQSTKPASKVIPMTPAVKDAVHESEVASLEKTVDDLNEKVKALHDALIKKGVAKAVQILEKEKGDLQSEVDRLKAQLSASKHAIGLPTLTEKLPSQVTDKEIDALSTRINKLSLEDLREETLDVTIAAARLKADNERLMTEMAAQNEHVASMERQIMENTPMAPAKDRETGELDLHIERLLRGNAKVKVTVDAVFEEHLEFKYGQ